MNWLNNTPKPGHTQILSCACVIQILRETITTYRLMYEVLNRSNESYWLVPEWTYFAWIFQDIFSFPTITNDPQLFDQLDITEKQKKEKKRKELPSVICS